jgi:hypothetical protein
MTGIVASGRIERRLARAENACGCAEGGASAVLATSAYTVLVLWPALHQGFDDPK